MSVKYCLPVPVFHFWPKLRTLQRDSRASCLYSRVNIEGKAHWNDLELIDVNEAVLAHVTSRPSRTSAMVGVPVPRAHSNVSQWLINLFTAGRTLLFQIRRPSFRVLLLPSSCGFLSLCLCECFRLSDSWTILHSGFVSSAASTPPLSTVCYIMYLRPQWLHLNIWRIVL